MPKKRKSLPAGYEINPVTGRKRKICPSVKIRSEKGNCVNVSKRKLKKKRKSLPFSMRTPSPKRKSLPFSMRTPSPNRITLSSFRTPSPKRKTPLLLVKMNRRTPPELRTPKSNIKFKPSPSFKFFEKNKRLPKKKEPEPVESHVSKRAEKNEKKDKSAVARANILKRFKLNKY